MTPPDASTPPKEKALLKDIKRQRLIRDVLTLYYIEGHNQTDIGKSLGMSTATVNRLIRQGHDQGMVAISINVPHAPLFDLEQKIHEIAPLDQVVVVPSVADDPALARRNVGAAAAQVFLDKLPGCNTITLTGGRGVASLIEHVETDKSFEVTVVPMNGAVQGRHYSDTNYLATQLAEKLGGGQAISLHAPLFAADEAERDVILNLSSSRGVLAHARAADIALVGIGNVRSPDSTMNEASAINAESLRTLEDANLVASVGCLVIDENGAPADHDLNRRVVSLSGDDIRNITYVIGVAFGVEKTTPVISALKGGYLNCLIVDETVASAVLTDLDMDA